MSERAPDDAVLTLRTIALEKAIQVTPKHNLMPDEIAGKVLATARKFEAFLRGEAAAE